MSVAYALLELKGLMYFSTLSTTSGSILTFHPSTFLSLPSYTCLSPVRILPHAPVQLTRTWWKPWQGHIPAPDCLLPPFQTSGGPCVPALCGLQVSVGTRKEPWWCTPATKPGPSPGVTHRQFLQWSSSNELTLQDWSSTRGVQMARGHSWEGNQAAD